MRRRNIVFVLSFLLVSPTSLATFENVGDKLCSGLPRGSIEDGYHFKDAGHLTDFNRGEL